jgi:hypothetical protein
LYNDDLDLRIIDLLFNFEAEFGDRSLKKIGHNPVKIIEKAKNVDFSITYDLFPKFFEWAF